MASDSLGKFRRFVPLISLAKRSSRHQGRNNQEGGGCSLALNFALASAASTTLRFFSKSAGSSLREGAGRSPSASVGSFT